MKNIKRNTLIKISTLVVMGAAIVYLGTQRYTFAVSELNQQAIGLFQDALKADLMEKNVAVDTFTIHRKIKTSAIGKTPKNVFIHTSEGEKEYILSPEKHHRNIVENVETRILHTIALKKNPIIADTLNTIWQQNLQNSHLIAKTALHITVEDQNNQIDSQNTTDYNLVASNRIPLFVCTLGYACEVEITAFIDYSWWFVFFRYMIIHLLIASGICMLIYLLVAHLFRMHSLKVIDALAPQLHVDRLKENVKIYELTNQVVFDAGRSVLILDQQKSVKLLPQLCVFLELLLNAEEYKLSDEAIAKELWPDNSSTSARLQQVVSRLRLKLKDLDSSFDIRRVHPSSYQLLL